MPSDINAGLGSTMAEADLNGTVLGWLMGLVSILFGNSGIPVLCKGPEAASTTVSGPRG